MAITYPTTLDAFTNPTANSLLTSPDHAQQHSDINDAVEALEAKVAIGNTVLGTYTAYTPTFASFTLGDGTLTSSYCQVNKFVHYIGRIVYGTTSSITGSMTISFPVAADTTFNQLFAIAGFCAFRDVSAVTNIYGQVNCNGGTGMFIQAANAASTYLGPGSFSSTIPFTWAVGDIITWNLYYRAG